LDPSKGTIRPGVQVGRRQGHQRELIDRFVGLFVDADIDNMDVVTYLSERFNIDLIVDQT